MAIKGKGKTKSRPAARAPRPAPVVRKPPFIVRRWVQVVAAVLLGMGIVVVVVWATNGVGSADADEARTTSAANARRVVAQWQTTVDGVISKIAPGSTAGTGSVTVLPELSASLETLAKGDQDRTASDTATTAIDLTREAATTLGSVDLPTLIRDNEGLDVAATNYVLNSKARMLDGIDLYGQVAKLVKTAVTTDDAAVADASIAAARDLVPIAQRVFAEGYADYTQALARVGLLQPNQGPSGLPGLTGNPSG
jgi:hypothetical protein